MTRTLERLLHETTGQDLAEYGIALAVVALGAAAAAVTVATDVNVLWTRAYQAITIVVLSAS
jgi:Flp pilus assembly pilin Flp